MKLTDDQLDELEQSFEEELLAGGDASVMTDVARIFLEKRAERGATTEATIRLAMIESIAGFLDAIGHSVDAGIVRDFVWHYPEPADSTEEADRG